MGDLVMSNAWTSDSILRVIVIGVAILVLFPLLIMAFMMPMMGMIGFGYGSDGMPGAYGGTGYGISPLWGIGMMLVFLVVLLGIGYILYRALVRGKHAFAAKEPALEELRIGVRTW